MGRILSVSLNQPIFVAVRIDPGGAAVEDTMIRLWQLGREVVMSNWSKWTNWLLLAIGVALLVFARVTAAGYETHPGINLSFYAYIVGGIAIAIQLILWVANFSRGSATQ